MLKSKLNSLVFQLPFCTLILVSFIFRYFSMRAKHQIIKDDKLRILIENNICREDGPQPNCFCIPVAFAWTVLKEVRFIILISPYFPFKSYPLGSLVLDCCTQSWLVYSNVLIIGIRIPKTENISRSYFLTWKSFWYGKSRNLASQTATLWIRRPRRFKSYLSDGKQCCKVNGKL